MCRGLNLILIFSCNYILLKDLFCARCIAFALRAVACCRWGSIEAVELLLLKAGLDNLISVFKDVLLQKLRGYDEASLSLPVAADDIDSLNAEEMSLIRKKLGRWKRDVLDLLGMPLFWGAIRVASHSRQPLLHLHRFLLRRVPDDDLYKTGPDGGGQLCKLVTGKAAEIGGDFEGLLDDDVDSFVAETWTSASNIDDALALLELLVELCGHHAASFNRRVTVPLSQCLLPDSF